MPNNKKYYYLKLKENFFESEEVILLESMTDGHIFSNILMKLYLKSLKNEGRLMFKDRIPYNAEMLATIVRHPVPFVEKTIVVLKDLGLIEVLDNGAIFMSDIQRYIGKDGSEAERLRQYRARIKSEKKALECTNVQQICTDVQDRTYERTPEIEIEIEKELDLEKETEIELEREKDIVAQSATPSPKISTNNDFLIDEIIKYLNLKVGKKFKSTTKAYRKEINGRLKQGASPEQFKYVIDVKTAEWLHNEEMKKNLNPVTLFRESNFDRYVNQEMPKQKEKTLRDLMNEGQIDLSDVL